MRPLLNCLAFFAAIMFYLPAFSQTNAYILNGSSTRINCNCYTLTQAINSQSGSVWNATKIDLTISFDFIFDVYLGCKDANGADGIVFMLQPLNTSVGAGGQGIGFFGVNPSVGIVLDTWQNIDLNDPAYDHISIQINGNSKHGNDLAGPVPISKSKANVEDCNWHTLRISWDAGAHWLRSYFDNELRVEAQVDLVKKIFNNNSRVYWGFSAGTGIGNNVQKFCTALNPQFSTNVPANAVCFNDPIAFQNESQSFAPISSYYWDFGDGTTSTAFNPPAHLYAAPGLYTVKLAITGYDGCVSDTSKKIVAIGDYPVAGFDVYDTCTGKPPRIIDQSTTAIGSVAKWSWVLDGNLSSTSRNPQFNNLAPGIHSLSLTVTSNYGCSSSPIQKQFEIKPSPVITADDIPGCINKPFELKARQIDNATNIVNWAWQSGIGQTGLQQTISGMYNSPGNYLYQVSALADNGCMSDIVTVTVIINEAVANAGNDTVIISRNPFHLHASGGISYNWLPALGLDNPSIANPVALLQDDMSYTLSVTTAEGCEDQDIINIKIFRGSSIVVPSAFTPNNDGLNDALRPVQQGIKTLHYFSVFNRWGGLVFSTKTIAGGWDGNLNGTKQSPGVYIWMLKATDYAGKVYDLKGTSVLIR